MSPHAGRGFVVPAVALAWAARSASQALGTRGQGPPPPPLARIDGSVSFWRAGAETEIAVASLETGHLQLEVISGHAAPDVQALPEGQRVEIGTPNGVFLVDRPGYYRVDVLNETRFVVRRGGEAYVIPAGGQGTRLGGRRWGGTLRVHPARGLSSTAPGRRARDGLGPARRLRRVDARAPAVQKARMRRLSLVVLASLAAAGMLAGCGASPPPVPSSEAVQGLPVVTVDVAPQIEAERVRVFDAQQGRERLRNAVLDELIDEGVRASPHAEELRVSVSRFRLRSTGTGFWLGAMAGADMLDVTVAVLAAGETVRTFETGAGGIAAGIVKPSAGGRFNGLVVAVAERIVEQLTSAARQG